mgnify:CR=1 FL=1
MGYGVKVDVRGDFALFTRPELKAERVSYDLITPSAARGVLEAVFWHPGLKWIVDEIRVLTPIKFTTVRRNEVSSKVKARVMWQAMANGGRPPYLATPKDIMQRASLLLTDVHYVITAHFEMTPQAAAGDNPGKFSEMFRRRLAKGQNYHQPYLGCREFPACRPSLPFRRRHCRIGSGRYCSSTRCCHPPYPARRSACPSRFPAWTPGRHPCPSVRPSPMRLHCSHLLGYPRFAVSHGARA